MQAVQVPAYHMRTKDLQAARIAEYLVWPRLFRIALQSHADARDREKAEKDFLAKSKLQPDFWTYFPNCDGRHDTMLAVLKSRGVHTENVKEVMPVYAEWLLTAKKTNENGIPINRWVLMNAWLDDTDL